MLELAHDLRVAVRGLRRTPTFAATTVLTFALAAGVVIAAYAVVHGVLLRPLPVRDQRSLVIAWKEDFKAGFAHFPFTHSSLDQIRPRLTMAAEVASIDYNGAWPLSLVEGDAGFKLPTGQVSGNFFPVLGIQPVIGRLFRPEDDVIGGPRLIVIGERLWRSRYGANPAILGRKVEIFGMAHEIVGVVPADFEYPRGAIAWIPMYPWQGSYLDGPDAVTQDIVARLKPGVTAAQFHAELEGIRATSPLETRPDFASHRVVSQPFADAVFGDLRPMLLLLGAGALVVLIVASANMGSLLVVRVGHRLPEIAVRAAIGGSRAQVWRAVAIEYALLVMIGILASLLVAWGGLAAARNWLPVEVPRSGVFVLSPIAVAVGGALSLILATVGGLVSAAVLVRANLSLYLRSGGRSEIQGWGTHPTRRILVAVQLTLAVVAAGGAGLLIRTLDRLNRIDPGLEPRHLLFGDITISIAGDSSFQASSPQMIDRLLETVEQIPGVASAATTFSPPFVREGGAYSRMMAEGQPRSELAGMPLANREAVTPGYFGTMGITLRRGRVLDVSDREGAVPVVVINEALARFHFPGKDPIGQRIGYADGPNPQWRMVVGVVADTRYNELKVPAPTIYVPYRQIEERPWYLLVRTDPRASTAAVVSALRREIHQLGLGLALVSATPMQDLLDRPIGSATTLAAVTFGFAAIALVLAAIGIYGVLSAFVAHRTREIGVRMALGAEGHAIAVLVVRQASRLIGVGLAGGLVASLIVGRGLRGFLYEITPTDPVTLGVVILVIAAMAAAALLAPALRAVRVDPAISLRSE